MTDNTSPVATLTARLPKGNGLTRAVPTLFEQRGALVPFIGFMRVEECGLDADDVQHLKGSIARFELCMGELDHDAKSLLARATTAANTYGGQQVLFAEPGEQEELQAQRDLLLKFLREWQAEQKPAVSDTQAADRWNSWHGGHYDARPEAAAPLHLREFLLSIGALAEDDDLEDRDVEDQDNRPWPGDVDAMPGAVSDPVPGEDDDAGATGDADGAT